MVFEFMSKTRAPDIIPPGEQFIKQTYIRLHHKKQGLTNEQAAQKLESELKAGTVEKCGVWNGVQKYRRV